MGQKVENDQKITTELNNKRPYPWLDYTITDF